MITDIDVINAALAKFQMKAISSLEDDNERSIAAKECWEMTLGSFLAEFDWSFATREAMLEKLAEGEADPHPFRHAYPLPNDLVKIVNVMAHDPFMPILVAYIMEGPEYEVRISGEHRQTKRILCSNWGNPYLRYISRDVTFDLFTPPALEAFTFRLAIALDMHLNAGSNGRSLGEFYAMARENAVNAEAGMRNRRKLSGTYTRSRTL